MTEKQSVGYVTQPGFTMPIPSAPPSYSEIEQVPINYPINSQSLYPATGAPAFPSAPVTISTNVSAPTLNNVEGQPVIAPVPIALGMESARIMCPHCHLHVKTITKCKSQKSAYVCCCILCLLGCCLCSCIPHCMKAFQNVHHYCPKCKTFIGAFQS